MSEPPYQQMLTELRDGTGYVFLDVQAPRMLSKQIVASLFGRAPSEQRPTGAPKSSVPVTQEQALELLAAGAEWKGPSHLKAELVPGS